MPPSLGFKVKSNVRLVRKDLEKLKGAPIRVSKNRLKQAALALKIRMQKPGKKVWYPIKWKSNKQRIKVIIMLRKQKNLPYKRKGKYIKAWTLVEYKNGYGVDNKLRGGIAKFIGGDKRGAGQQPFHEGRWVLLRNEYDKVRKQLPKVLVSAMREEVKRVPKHQPVQG